MPPSDFGPLTLLVGPAHCGKTTAALRAYAGAILGRPDGREGHVLWLAPTQAAARDVREALVSEAGAVLEPGVGTFATFAAATIRGAGLWLRPIAPLQRRRLLGRLIAQAAAAGDLQHYAPVAGSPGLVNILDEAIAHLAHRGVTPADARESARLSDDPRSRDIAELYARYRALLTAADLIDDAALLAVASAVLKSREQREPTYDLVVVDGFSDFTQLELQLVRQLAAVSQRTLVTLPGEGSAWHALKSSEGRGAVENGTAVQPRPTADRGTCHSQLGSATPRPGLFARSLATSAALLEVPGSRVFPLERCQEPWPALAHLERNLFRNFRDLEPLAPAAAQTVGRLAIVAASGVQAEIEEIARRVKRLLVDGVSPGDVVVAFRSTRDLADRIRLVFDDFGVPTALDASRRLAATALVRSLSNVLRLVADDWSYRRLLHIAGDRSLRMLDAHAGARTAIETCVRHAQLPSGRGALLYQLDHWAADDDATAEPTAATATTAAAALRELAKALDKLPRRKNVDGWIAAIGPLAERLGLIRPAGGDTAGNWAILVGALQAAGHIDAWTGWGAEELSLAEFVELLTTTAAQTPAAERRDATGRVRVLSAEAARFTRPRHLLVGNLSEQAFPAMRGAASAIDDVAIADSRSDEMLLFYQLVTRPTETLTLSYPALDQRAQALPPSPFLTELERTFGGAIERTVQPLDGGRSQWDEKAAPLSRSGLRRGAVGRALERDRDLLAALASPSGRHALRSSAGRGGGAEPSPKTPRPAEDLGRATPDIGQSILAGIDAIADRGRRDEFGPFEGIVASDAVATRLLERFGPDHLWSPSQLETYAGCPFVFFGKHLLGLRPTPEMALENDMSRRGAVLHETLAQLYAQLRGAPTADAILGSEQLAALVLQQFHETLTAVSQARPGRGLSAALREIERRQIAAWAENFAQQDAAYRRAWPSLDVPLEPAYFEARFGRGSRASESTADAAVSTDKPFELPVAVEGVAEVAKFTGQIDRIDVGRVGDSLVFNVVDYKSGKHHAVNEADIHAGKQLQLPLYAMAAQALGLAGGDAVPLTAGYWAVQGKGYGSKGGAAGALAFHQVEQGKLRPDEAWKTTRERLVAKIGELIAAIRRGQFPVYNNDPQCTTFCDLRTICRINHIRSLDKHWPVKGSSRLEKESENGTRMNADMADERGSEK